MPTIYRGASFILSITVKGTDGEPMDLTGATARAEVRSRAAKSATLILDLNPQIDDAEGGVIAINVPPAETAALEPGEGVWDLLLETADEDTLVIIPTEAISIRPLATAPE